MGIAWLLLQRTFAAKPKRTLLFLLGYGLATAVMVTLLAVGEAVLQQARDKNLFGGGDLILVPQGIDLESMKVGGISALYYSIPQARFIVRQFLQSSRFENEIDSVSPYIVPKLAYIRQVGKREPPLHAFAEGSLPDQENRIKNLHLPWHNDSRDNSWLKPPVPDFYHELDRFHLPSIDSPDMKRWSEWHYFNFESGSFHGYLSIMVAGDILQNQAVWIVSLRMYDGKYRRFENIYPAFNDSLPLKKIDYSAGPNQIRYEKDHYEITLNFTDQVPVEGKLLYYPAEGLYVPPTFLARRSDFESGYVIPAIRGKYQGSIRIGNTSYDFDGIEGYHDHNWGIWRQIEWNWGHARSEEFAIFFGEIYLENKSKGLFAGVYDSKGFVTLLRPERIHFSDYQKTTDGLTVPLSFKMEAQKRFSSMTLSAKADRFVTTALEGQILHFVQYKMTYDVKLQIDGKKHHFKATGNAETFVK
ncbi:hypothetical protein L0156_04060 [bacterium]|nr:hypothetical protein [bacterium]